MDHHDLAWDDLRYVRAVAEAGSVRGAAATRGVSHQTVARHIARLEASIGVQLFVKSPAGYLTTPAAEDLVRTAARVADLIGDSARRLAAQNSKPAGVVRLATIDWLAQPLSADFADFHLAYPEIQLELLGGTSVVSLAKREADIALRLVREPTGDLVGRKLAVSRAGIYASAAYLQRTPAKRPLGEHTWVAVGGPWASLRPGQWLTEHVPAERVAARCAVTHAIPHLIEAGVGVGLLPCFVGDAHPRLQRVRPDPIDALEVPVWLLTHPDVRRTTRVRALFEFLAVRLEAQRHRFEGRAR